MNKHENSFSERRRPPQASSKSHIKTHYTTMKNIFFFTTLTLSLLLAFTSCEDFLEKAPLDKVSTDGTLTEADAIAMVNAAYQPLQWPKLYNMRMWTTDIIAGNSVVGANGGTDGIETTDLANFIASSANAAAVDIWRGPNPGILRCNLVLQEIPQLDIDEEIKDRLLGEAYFLRAHYNFILVRTFGDIPLALTPATPGSDLSQKRVPQEDVYRQILKDTQAAIELLPAKSEYGNHDLGRASKDAALAMMAKIKLTLASANILQGDFYTSVVNLCDSVTALGYDLSLYNYADNFDAAIDNNPESLFEVQYDGDPSEDFWGDANRSSWLSTFMGPRNSGLVAGSWGWNQPTQEFVDAYEEGDLRKDVTIFYEGGPSFDGKDYDPSWSGTGYNVRKFLAPFSVSYEYNTNPANFVVYRYADVLLMKAEALNELGRTQEAAAPLNEVRDRAGLSPIGDETQDQMRQIIIHERRMELAFEGHRWFDLVRIQNGAYAVNFFKSIGKQNVTKDRLLFPIPQEEIDDNPQMTQNKGY